MYYFVLLLESIEPWSKMQAMVPQIRFEKKSSHHNDISIVLLWSRYWHHFMSRFLAIRRILLGLVSANICPVKFNGPDNSIHFQKTEKYCIMDSRLNVVIYSLWSLARIKWGFSYPASQVIIKIKNWHLSWISTRNYAAILYFIICDV